MIVNEIQQEITGVAESPVNRKVINNIDINILHENEKNKKNT